MIKRYNFEHKMRSHGNSLSHRAPGSIGQSQTPGRYLKARKWLVIWVMYDVTVQGHTRCRVDAEH